ncbi:FAD-binding oxidoreductase [Nocardia sp. NPDC051911]|uniref:FAD-binding oxidoreductase n=1 Tax=Nocardia sp. NPDC051911 TaxID=3154648 RepID=UPI003416EE50
MTEVSTPSSVLDGPALAAALEEFRSIVGPGHVFTESAALADFRDPYQPKDWDRQQYAPVAVVQPATTEEVQAIVRAAGRHGVRLWTQSQGRNNGYGGAAPRVLGCVTLNLRRMNRILEIDEEMGYALVEPGVSFMQLHEAIRDAGDKLMLSVPDIGWGSVVGNALDHGTTYLPQGSDFMSSCGLEVVTADGRLLRTGMGAQTGNPSWNLYRRGLGPSLDQLFMQSNFGVVTKMGVWLMPKPKAVMPISVTVSREEHLVELVDGLRRLRLDGVLRGVPIIVDTLCFATMVSRRDQWHQGPGPIPDDVIQQIGETLGVGRWMARLCLYGDDVVVDHHYATVEQVFGAIPGAVVRGTKWAGDELDQIPTPTDRVQAGIPSLDLAQMAAWSGGETGGHMGFSPVVPMRGAEVYRLHRLVREIVESRGLDYANYLIAINERSMISVAGQTFDSADEDQTRRAYEICRHLVREVGKLGYSEYRAHLNYMDLAMDQFDFGDHAYLRFVEKIKDAVDPTGIFSPGKQGIWPKDLRAGPA